MPIRFDFSKDTLYLRGKKEERERLAEERERLTTKLTEEKERLATKLTEEQKLIYIKLLDILSIPEIVERFGVSVEYLEALKKE